MRLRKGLLLLALVQLLLQNTNCQTTDEPETEEELNDLAEENADGDSHKADIVVDNGEETNFEENDDNVHGNGMEVIIQELQREVELAEEGPEGDVVQKILDVAHNILGTDEEAAPSEQHTALELPYTNSSTNSSVTKRQLYPRSKRWPKGIVPYSFTDVRAGETAESAEGQANIIKAFKFLEGVSCLRFPKWTPTVHAENNLTHSNYLRYIVPDDGGCWSYVGMGGGTGQAISCCGSTGVCIHEIGHAVGYLHEQDRSDRDKYVALHPENADPKHTGTFSGGPNYNTLNFHIYDLGSMMQYGMFGFSHTGMPTLTPKDPKQKHLIGNREGIISHYDQLSLTAYYDCAENCPADKRALKCKNDGFLDIHCKCKCTSLFAGDTCEKLYSPTAEPTKWPKGSYGIPQTNEGCPDGAWSTGFRTHATESNSYTNSEGKGKLQPFAGNLVEDHFCMRSDTTTGTSEAWPEGFYCIYQQGNACPAGFESGWINIDDDNNRSGQNSVNGSLPKGEFGQDTKYYYCCRGDGDTSTPIELPKAKPFHLLRYGGSCQTVAGMHSVTYYLRYNQEDTSPSTTYQDPRPSFSKWWGDVILYYCYYTALSYDCGGMIDLTESKPSVNIITPNYPNNYDNLKECVWYIKAPEGKQLAVDFTDFDIEESSGSCVDGVELRINLLGQPGERYCGEGFKRTLISPSGFAFIDFKSGISGTRRGFNGTVRYITDEEQCYNTKDHGKSYRGTVYYTQHYHKCIPWEQAKHCDVNPFDRKYMNSGLVGNNYCRNPNDLLRPWCYYNEHCDYDFCEVCGIAKCYDFFEDCSELTGKDPEYYKTEEAFHGCHKTSEYCGTNIFKNVSSCSPPVVKDKNAVIETAKASQKTFNFGETVNLECKNTIDGAKITSELTCMSDGSYTGLQLFCGISCQEGWTRYKENCYKMTQEQVHYNDAKEACAASKATLTSIRDKEENDFVKSLASGNTVWIGINDAERTNNWHWEDGSTSPYRNWVPGEPSGGSERCGVLKKDGHWNDIYCEIHYPKYYICKKAHEEYEADYYCQDEDPNCYDIIGRNYKICKENREYAEMYCRRSCGLCPVLTCPNPGTVKDAVMLVNASYIDAGNYFEYKCSSGMELLSGTLGRTCLRTGTITGKPPVCKPEAQFEDTYGHRVISRPKTEKPGRLTVFDSTESIIKRNGKALRWEIYSTSRTTIVAQVWRRTLGNVNATFQLIGESMHVLRPKRVNRYNLKSFEGFTVQNGDLLGWYTPPGKQGLTYSDCDYETFANRTVYQMEMSELSGVKVGMQKTFEVVDKCRTYSISLTVGAGTSGTYSNVAAANRGGKCIDASTNKFICGLAIDGGLAPYDSAWMSDNEGAGASITIRFDDTYNIVGARIMQGLSKKGQIKRLTLSFSDNSKQQVGLSERQGTTGLDLTGAHWDTFDLTPVASSWVKLTVNSIYSTDYNGFIEVEMYAACLDGWSLHGSNCYKLETESVSFSKAEESCGSSSNAHVTSITSADENAHVAEFAKNVSNVWIGYTDSAVEGTFVWTDGSTSNYTNWKTGNPDNFNRADCTSLSTSSKNWDDIHCSWYPRPFVCKRQADNVKQMPYSTHGNSVQPRSYTQGSGDIGEIYVQKNAALTVPKPGSIMAWKLYTAVDYDITMMVLQPVANEENKYTVGGENTISIKANVTNIISIAEFARIKVQKGDVIAWYYLPGADPAIPYDTCNTEMDTKYVKHPTTEALYVGQTLTFKATSWRKCRIYSVSFIMTEDQPSYENVATLTSLAKCTGASSGQSMCGTALDGKFTDWDSAWVTNSAGPQQSMSIELGANYTIVGGRVMQRFNSAAQIKTLKLDFGNSNVKEVTLRKREGSADGDYRAQLWDVFSFSSPIDSNTVNINITATYSHGEVGIIEFELYSTGCPTGWTRYKNSCYKKNPTIQFYWPSETACKAEGAHVSSTSGKAESEFLTKMADGKYIYLGYTLDNGQWVAADGSTMTYTNWKPGQPNGARHSEYCISLGSDGQWEDQYCQWYYAKTSICKKPLQTRHILPYTMAGNHAVPRSRKDGSSQIGYIYTERSDTMTIQRDGSIQGWKIYSDAVTDLTILVLRPVAGTETEYIIKGENFLRTPNGTTETLTVPDFDVINVKAGDVVGWLYLPGSDPAIQYSSCSSSQVNVKIMYAEVPSKGPPLTVGQKISTTITNWYGCRIYSVGFILSHDTSKKISNVAAATRGGQCTEASSNKDICSLAIDGGIAPYDSAWLSNNEGVGASLKINLDGTYKIIGMKLKQRLSKTGQIRGITLTFSDASTQMTELGERQGTSSLDFKASYWDVVQLTPVATSFVKLSVDSVYSTDYNGFIEIEIYAGCLEGWNLHGDNCYKVQAESVTFSKAEADCTSASNAHITSIGSSEENTYLADFAKSKSEVWIGYTDGAVEGTWKWTDESTGTYTNWKSGEPSNWNNEDCAALVTSNKEWRDIDCVTDSRAYVCKRQANNMRQMPYSVHGIPVQPRGSKDGSSQIGRIYLQQNDDLTVPKSGSIMAWKLYTDVDYIVTMVVLRPVSGEANKYTFMGENTVSTKRKVANIISISDFDRIKVNKGDIIAWYYLPGADPAIPYDTCNSGTTNITSKYIHHPKSGPLIVGQTESAAVITWYTCRRYSISYIMTTDQSSYENVAALTAAAKCSGASSGESMCGMTLDGKLKDWDSTWVTATPAVGQNMSVELAGKFSVIGGRIMQRFSSAAQIKTLKLDFGNSNIQEVQLRKRHGSSDSDYRAQFWDTFTLDSPVDSQHVSLSIGSVYSDGKVGIIEFELYSTGCNTGWTRYQNNCYKKNPTVEFYGPSEEACKAQGAHISSVSDRAESDFLYNFAGGSIYLGYTLVNGQWVAADGSSMTYTNWKQGQPNGASNSEYCISLWSEGQWEDQYCQWYYAKASICKKPLQTSQALPYTIGGNEAIPGSRKDGTSSIGYIYVERSTKMTVSRDGSIQGWKIYTDTAADVTVVVLRPVQGSETAYTIIGETVIRTPVGTSAIITVNEFDQINVKSGDLVAWYYLPGSDPTIQYNTCSSSNVNVKIMYAGVPSSGPPFAVGQQIATTITSWYACRIYSVGFVLSHETQAKLYNVAEGASCTASTSTDICSLAVDGGLYAYGSAWISRGEGVNAWVDLNLGGSFKLRAGRIQQRYATTSRIKDLELTFSDGSKQQVHMGERAGSSQTSYISKAWDSFGLNEVQTTSVKLTVKAVYGADEVGFVEVQMLSEGCMVGWTLYQGSCYYFHTGDKKSWNYAKADCISKGAHLVTLANQAENDFVKGKITSDAFIGHQVVGNGLIDVLGNAVTYINWRSGEPSGNGNCVTMVRSDGRWDDLSCTSNNRRWTCERAPGSSGTSMKTVGGPTEPRSKLAGDARIQIADGFRFSEAGTVTAWKVYGKKDSTAIFEVWRPVINETGKFTLVGSTSGRTEEGRVTLVKIPPLWQIRVEPNDVIGYQFPKGDTGVVWDSCNNNDHNMMSYERKSSWSNPEPGSTVLLNSLPNYYPCRIYSVSAVVEAGKEIPQMSNVGAASLGATCEASDNSDNCGKVIDGDTSPSSEWKVTTSTVTTQWIKLTFEESYPVEYISIMQRFGSAGQSKTILLEFSDNTTQEVTLKPRTSGSFTDTRNGFWDDFAITKVDTTFIKFTIDSVYTESENGFVEIKVFAECASGYVRYNNHCYQLKKEKLKYFPANDKCKEDNAKFVRIDDDDENTFITKLAGGQTIWIGFRDDYKGKPDGVWSWEAGGGAYTYTHWKSGNPSGSGTWGYCARLHADGLWQDAYCKWYNNLWFVCEKDAPGISAASTAKRDIERRDDVSTTSQVLVTTDGGDSSVDNGITPTLREGDMGFTSTPENTPIPEDLVTTDDGFTENPTSLSMDRKDVSDSVNNPTSPIEGITPPPRYGDIGFPTSTENTISPSTEDTGTTDNEMSTEEVNPGTTTSSDGSESGPENMAVRSGRLLRMMKNNNIQL